METILFMLIVALAVMMVWNFYLRKQMKICQSGKGCDGCECNRPSDDVKEAVASLLRVVDKTKIIEELQFEGTCKRALIDEFKSLIFFHELKDEHGFYERLKKKEKSYNDKPWNVPEHQALAEVYHELVCYAKHHIKADEEITK